MRAGAVSPGTWQACVPIAYTRQPFLLGRVFAPHTFVAFVPDHDREVFDAAAEGGFPPFVLEVLSPTSAEHDQLDKRRAYNLLGAHEFAFFTPRADAPSTLEGYRRDPTGAFIPWLPDAGGRVWSDVLQLYLVVRGPLLQAQTPDGRLLLTPEQAADAYLSAEEARLRAEDNCDASWHATDAAADPPARRPLARGEPPST